MIRKPHTDCFLTPAPKRGKERVKVRLCNGGNQ